MLSATYAVFVIAVLPIIAAAHLCRRQRQTSPPSLDSNVVRHSRRWTSRPSLSAVGRRHRSTAYRRSSPDIVHRRRNSARPAASPSPHLRHTARTTHSGKGGSSIRIARVIPCRDCTCQHVSHVVNRTCHVSGSSVSRVKTSPVGPNRGKMQVRNGVGSGIFGNNYRSPSCGVTVVWAVAVSIPWCYCCSSYCSLRPVVFLLCGLLQSPSRGVTAV